MRTPPRQSNLNQILENTLAFRVQAVVLPPFRRKSSAAAESCIQTVVDTVNAG
jgi:hypothetical protein